MQRKTTPNTPTEALHVTPPRHRPAETARVAETSREGLVEAAVLAEYLGVSRAFVYEHADELGARRLGSGPRARLRFSLAEADARLTGCTSSRESEEALARTVEPKPRRRRSSVSGSEVELLPIRGQRVPFDGGSS